MRLDRKNPPHSRWERGGTFWRIGVGFEPTSRLRDYLISSLFCNCDGGVRFGVVSVSPVPAESRLKSGFFAQKVLRDRLF